MQSLQKSEDRKESILRPLDRAETNFWLYDRVSSMNFTVMAELSGPVSIEKLQKATDRVQSLHTNAQVSIVKREEETPYLAFAEAPSRKIQFQIFDESDWRNHLASETIRPFSLGEAPLIRGLLYRQGNDDYTLAFVFNHSIADGRSGCYFLLDVLKEYGSGKENSAFIPHRFRSMMELSPKFPDDGVPNPGPGKPDSLPNFSKKKENPRPSLISFSLSRPVLTGLLQNAKANGTSLHGAIGAAQALAFAKLFSDSDSKSILLATPADLRPYFSESVPSEFLGMYITLLTTRMDLKSEFWSLAKTVTTDLRKKLANAEGKFFYEALPSADQFLKREETMRVLGSVLSRTPQASVLSNVGVLPDPGEDLEIRIKNVSFTVHPFFTQTLFTTVTTFRGQAILNLNYDSNRWAQDDMDAYINEFKAILYRESKI